MMEMDLYVTEAIEIPLQEHKNGSTGQRNDGLEQTTDCDMKTTTEDDINPSVANSQTEMEPPVIPWGKIGCIMLCLASDYIALEAPLPYLPQYCRIQLGIPEQQVGTYVGSLNGAFHFANFLSSAFLGYLSDICGRKVFLLSGIFITFIFTVALGFLTGAWAAICTRVAIGLLNSNMAIGKAAIADIVPSHVRATPLAYTGASYALARAFSSLIGALCVGLFWADTFGPFVAPLIISAIPLMIAFLTILLALPETNKSRKYASLGRALFHRDRGNEPAGLDCPASHADGVAIQPKRTFAQGLRVISRDLLMVWLIVAFDMLAFSNGGLFSAAVLWMTGDVKRHGMHMNEQEAGVGFTIFGLSGFIFQLALFKRLNKVLGLRRMLQSSMLLMCIGCMMLPAGQSLLAGQNLVLTRWKWVVVTPSLGILGVGFVVSLPVLSTIISNSAVHEIQGLTQGVAQSTSSLLRGMGPFVTGAVFSGLFDLHAPAICFAIFAASYIIVGCIALLLPPRVEGASQSDADPEQTHARECMQQHACNSQNISPVRFLAATRYPQRFSSVRPLQMLVCPFSRRKLRRQASGESDTGRHALICDDSVAASHIVDSDEIVNDNNRSVVDKDKVVVDTNKIVVDNEDVLVEDKRVAKSCVSDGQTCAAAGTLDREMLIMHKELRGCVCDKEMGECMCNQMLEKCVCNKHMTECVCSKAMGDCMYNKMLEECVCNEALRACICDKDMGECMRNKTLEKFMRRKELGECVCDKELRECMCNKIFGECVHNKDMGECVCNKTLEKLMRRKELGECVRKKILRECMCNEEWEECMRNKMLEECVCNKDMGEFVYKKELKECMCDKEAGECMRQGKSADG